MANKIRGIPGLRTHIQQGGCPHTVPRLKAKKFIQHPFDLMHRRTGASTVIPLRPWDTEEPRMRACAARVHKEGKSRTGSLTRFSAKRGGRPCRPNSGPFWDMKRNQSRAHMASAGPCTPGRKRPTHQTSGLRSGATAPSAKGSLFHAP